jgi:NAD(P)-dependent dehydrogenase (short-subunit alcohol dehydrogenase family)
VSTIEAAVGKGKVALVQADVSTEEGARKIVDETLRQFGVDHIDVLVNNASSISGGATLQCKAHDMMRTFQVAVVGPVMLLQAAYPHMPSHSRIINIGSVAAKMGFVQMPVYSAAKAAMDQLTWTLSQEVSLFVPLSRGVTRLTHGMADWSRWQAHYH